MADAALKANMFLWEGTDKTGKKVKGEMSGSSDALIKATLRRQGINPQKVKKKPKSLFSGGKKKITAKDISIFSRQMGNNVIIEDRADAQELTVQTGHNRRQNTCSKESS